MADGASGWFRRRAPRLSGTLHIRDATGRELVVPLRGRAALLTAGGTGLRGYGEVWAVHTATAAATTGLMIVYGTTEAAADRCSGLCAAGQTVTLGGVAFTWRAPAAPPARLPQPRTPMTNVPRHHLPARSTNTRDEPAGLRGRLRNMVRLVTQRPDPR